MISFSDVIFFCTSSLSILFFFFVLLGIWCTPFGRIMPFPFALKKKSYVNAYRYKFHKNKRKEQKFKGTVQQYGNMSSSAPAMGRAAVCSVWCHEVQACLVISCVVSCHCMALQTWS